MILSEKRKLIDELAQDYLYQKENNVVWRREPGFSYGVALGKLFGACTAFGFEIDETDKCLLIKNGSRILGFSDSVVERHKTQLRKSNKNMFLCIQAVWQVERIYGMES